VDAGSGCLKGSGRLLPKLPAFPVYLFDIDGTLLDSAADICGAIQSAFVGHVPEPLPYEYLKTFIGYHLDVCFKEVLPHYSREQLDELLLTYRTAYPARRHAGTSRYPGVLETLEALPGRKGTATTKAHRPPGPFWSSLNFFRTSTMCRARTAFLVSRNPTSCCVLWRR
jgi:hypothetical protein